MMLNFVNKKKGDSGGRRNVEAQRNVENWVKKRGAPLFRRDPSTQLMVMEVACNDPNCAPIDTIVILMSSSMESDMKHLSSMDKEKEEKEGKKEGKWIGKVPKRTIEVTEEDIELLFIPESLTKEGLEKIQAAEEEHEAARVDAKDKVAVEDDKDAKKEEESPGADMVEVVIDDGWMGRRTMMVRKARAPPPRDDDPKHRKG